MEKEHKACGEKTSDHLYKIGMFAQMNHITIKTLHFYEEQGLLALHVMVDPVGDGLDALLDFVLANKRFEPFVLNLYDTHEYEFNNFSAKLQKI